MLKEECSMIDKLILLRQIDLYRFHYIISICTVIELSWQLIY